jgi:hypothetical protein
LQKKKIPTIPNPAPRQNANQQKNVVIHSTFKSNTNMKP